MRYSKSITKTLRENPNGADTLGYKALLRAGFIKQLGAGIFDLLPFGLKTIRKIEGIIRDEMNRAGGQEVSMPVVNPADIWKKTGRYYSIGSEMTRFNDRNGKDMVLAMTHEEAVTELVLSQLDSYKKMPLLVYQIQTKWRDDPRPRAGLIRVREFTMKDAYSFDRDTQGLEKQYQAMYNTYFRIFTKLGLPSIAVASDTGMMGGKIAHEYMYLSPVGEDTIIICDKCGYNANKQVAKFDKSIKQENQKEKKLEKVHTPNVKSIEDVSKFLNTTPQQCAKAVFMTGVFKDKDDKEYTKLIVAVIRGDLDVEENKLLNAAGANDIRAAREDEISECGMVAGFASPIAAKGKKDFIVIVDDSIVNAKNLIAGANKEGYHYINANYPRDFDGKVCDIAGAKDGYVCPHCKSKLRSSRGVEIGNIFQLGTKYSQNFNLTFQDVDSVRKPVIMGCYGIGVGRALGCLAEEYCDEKGLKLPIYVSPFEISFISLLSSEDVKVSDEIYEKLTKAGLDVLYDDRNENAGVKFADNELIGSPIIITLGKKGLKNSYVEFSMRGNENFGKKEVAIKDCIEFAKKLRDELRAKIDSEVNKY